MTSRLTRRSVLRAAGLGSLTAGLGGLAKADDGAGSLHGGRHDGHLMGVMGSVDTSIFDPGVYLRS